MAFSAAAADLSLQVPPWVRYHKANLWYEAALDASKEPTYDHDHI